MPCSIWVQEIGSSPDTALRYTLPSLSDAVVSDLLRECARDFGPSWTPGRAELCADASASAVALSNRVPLAQVAGPCSHGTLYIRQRPAPVPAGGSAQQQQQAAGASPRVASKAQHTTAAAASRDAANRDRMLRSAAAAAASSSSPRWESSTQLPRGGAAAQASPPRASSFSRPRGGGGGGGKVRRQAVSATASAAPSTPRTPPTQPAATRGPGDDSLCESTPGSLAREGVLDFLAERCVAEAVEAEEGGSEESPPPPSGSPSPTPERGACSSDAVWMQRFSDFYAVHNPERAESAMLSVLMQRYCDEDSRRELWQMLLDKYGVAEDTWRASSRVATPARRDSQRERLS
eukprot:Rhum_TRINITY_DN12945_c0_g1::Rhum_TRINITY_DN12945_c0_g1_i2::g.55334::m.55334